MLRDYWKTLPQYLLPKQALTHLAGFLADVRVPAVKNYLISDFVKKYGVNMSEAVEEDPLQYGCFNDFFIRKLKPEKRPLAKADIVCPVDGSVSEAGRIEQGQILQAKGRSYRIEDLLACDSAQSHPFSSGSFATLYLSPKDYHRIHMPLDATLNEMIYVPGRLFSVQPATTRVIPNLFARNERLVLMFTTPQAGLMAMVLVGATIVGSITTSWHGALTRSKTIRRFAYPDSGCDAVTLRQGDEAGYFKLGSTVILLFADERVHWLESIRAGSNVRFGQAMSQSVS